MSTKNQIIIVNIYNLIKRIVFIVFSTFSPNQVDYGHIKPVTSSQLIFWAFSESKLMKQESLLPQKRTIQQNQKNILKYVKKKINKNEHYFYNKILISLSLLASIILDQNGMIFIIAIIVVWTRLSILQNPTQISLILPV